jgi:hypothetical protein
MNASASRAQARTGLTPAGIGRAATLALWDELSLSPKPGLVTLVDCGSHDDMDAHTFMRSLFALRQYFVQIAEAGFAGAEFAVLERLGIDAEARMLAATGGVNTHRGAIFMLGLLCASAGAVTREHGGVERPAQLREALRRHWVNVLARRSQRTPTLPGGIAARRHGLRSAKRLRMKVCASMSSWLPLSTSVTSPGLGDKASSSCSAKVAARPMACGVSRVEARRCSTTWETASRITQPPPSLQQLANRSNAPTIHHRCA